MKPFLSSNAAIRVADAIAALHPRNEHRPGLKDALRSAALHAGHSSKTFFVAMVSVLDEFRAYSAAAWESGWETTG